MPSPISEHTVPWPEAEAARYVAEGYWAGIPIGHLLRQVADATPGARALADPVCRVALQLRRARRPGRRLRDPAAPARPELRRPYRRAAAERLGVRRPHAGVPAGRDCPGDGAARRTGAPSCAISPCTPRPRRLPCRTGCGTSTIRHWPTRSVPRCGTRRADRGTSSWRVTALITAASTCARCADRRPTRRRTGARWTRPLPAPATSPYSCSPAAPPGHPSSSPAPMTTTPTTRGRAHGLLPSDADAVYLVSLPAGHNFPLACPGILGTLLSGGTVIMLPSPEPARAFAAIAAEGVTHTAVVPAVAGRWLEHAAASGPDELHSLRVLQVGGARIADELARRVRPRLGAQLQQVFGMAEGLLNYTRLDDPEDVICGTQGRPLSAADEIRLVDGQDKDVPDGEPGSLLTRGPYTPRGYYRAPEQNARAYTPDGWYRSGDICRRDPAGQPGRRGPRQGHDQPGRGEDLRGRGRKPRLPASRGRRGRGRGDAGSGPGRTGLPLPRAAGGCEPDAGGDPRLHGTGRGRAVQAPRTPRGRRPSCHPPRSARSTRRRSATTSPSVSRSEQPQRRRDREDGRALSVPTPAG